MDYGNIGLCQACTQSLVCIHSQSQIVDPAEVGQTWTTLPLWEVIDGTLVFIIQNISKLIAMKLDMVGRYSRRGRHMEVLMLIKH